MLSKTGLIILTILICGSQVLADEVDRKGPALGLGIGIAPMTGYSHEGGANYLDRDRDLSEMGLGFNLVFGYAVHDLNMITLTVNGAILDGGSGTSTQGFAGPVWYHFFSRSQSSAFITLGPGVYLYDSYTSGIGLLAGFGVHVSRHWQMGGYYAYGRTNGGKNTHNQLNFLVSFISF
ncbi:MAG: hypothetical protein GY841_14000 [FCB group bacterium]|nr:hypothetical protein [FCB group bacterium]